MTVSVTLVNEKLAHARGGEVVLYKRGDSTRWQARFKLKDLNPRKLHTPSCSPATLTKQSYWAKHSTDTETC